MDTFREAIPYVLPFALFMVLLAIAGHLEFLGVWEYPARSALLTAVVLVFSRRVIDLRIARPAASVVLGVVVFLLWIGPDTLIPGYRNHWLFQNSLTGQLRISIPPELRQNLVVLGSRSYRAIILVPIIEELFWRAWLMRWLIDSQFWKVRLGAFTVSSMWITATLFASEHGPYWEVGLVAGLLYNWWMVRTKSLGDCILAHAVTNACICAYAIGTANWQYWM